MKKLSGKVTGIIVLYIVFSFCWGFIDFNVLPEPLKGIVSVVFGPLVILSIFLLLLLKCLWRLPVINKLMQIFIGSNPVISGTWEGVIEWEAEEMTKKIDKEKTVFLSIFQPDAFTIYCWLYTNERKSRSLLAGFEEDNGIGTFTYTYESDESVKNKIGNPRHAGVTVLRLGSVGRQLSFEGYYYTSRKTAGSISVRRKTMQCTHSFSEASRLCGHRNMSI